MIDETTKIPINVSDNVSDEVSWRIKEPIFSPQNKEMLWALGIIGVAVIIFSVLLKNYLFILIVAIAALIVHFAKSKEEMIDFRLNTDGFYINEKFYPYENFESFWIFPAQSDRFEREFVLRYKKHLMPLLTIPFYDKDETGIRNLLTNHLEKNEEKESLIDLLRKRFF